METLIDHNLYIKRIGRNSKSWNCDGLSTLTYYRAMVAQNFMIIRQLDKLNTVFSGLAEAEKKN